MPTYGANPAKNVEPRTCAVCGSTFTPYRKTQETCGIKCYRRTDEYRAKEAAYKARPEVRSRKNAQRRVENSPDRRVANRAQLLRSRYGLTAEQHDAMLAEQRGLCFICGNPPDPNGVKAASRLHVDHDHVTGKVRSLICNHCNRGVGAFRDDPELMRVAALYILKHRESQ